MFEKVYSWGILLVRCSITIIYWEKLDKCVVQEKNAVYVTLREVPSNGACINWFTLHKVLNFRNVQYHRREK